MPSTFYYPPTERTYPYPNGAFYLTDGRTAQFRDVAGVGGQLIWINPDTLPADFKTFYGNAAVALMMAPSGRINFGEDISSLVSISQAKNWAQAWYQTGFPPFTPPVWIIPPTFDPGAAGALINDPNAQLRQQEGVDQIITGTPTSLGAVVSGVTAAVKANPALWLGGAAMLGLGIWYLLAPKKRLTVAGKSTKRGRPDA